MSDIYIPSHHVFVFLFLHMHMLGREYMQVTAPHLGSRSGSLNAKRPASLRLNLLDAGRRSLNYFLLRRWWRVLRSSLRCFFLDIRLRRFLITEPIGFPHFS